MSQNKVKIPSDEDKALNLDITLIPDDTSFEAAAYMAKLNSKASASGDIGIEIKPISSASGTSSTLNSPGRKYSSRRLNQLTGDQSDENTQYIRYRTIFDRAQALMAFDMKEVSLFKLYSGFFVSNPRKIKRITNIYRAVRLLAIDQSKLRIEEKIKFQKKLLLWIILMEQWPVRMAWLLQVIQDDEQTENILFHSPRTSLYEIYKKYVEARVYDTRINFGPTVLAASYHRVFILDADPELFDALLLKCEQDLRYEDVGNSIRREKGKLLTYTINLNPALQAVIACIAGHREDETIITEVRPVKYSRRSASVLRNIQSFESLSCQKLVEWIKTLKLSNNNVIINEIMENEINGEIMNAIMHGGPEQTVNYNALIELGISKAVDQFKFTTAWKNYRTNLLFDLHEATRSKSNVQSPRGSKTPRDGSQSPNQPQRQTVRVDSDIGTDNKSKFVDPSRRTTDDKHGKDHIGYVTYAWILSMMVQYGVSAPSVFGIYATWGTGKSFIMNKCIAALKTFWLRDRAKIYFHKKRKKLIRKWNMFPNKLSLKLEQLESLRYEYESILENLLNEDDDAIDVLYLWTLIGCPYQAIEYTIKDGKEIEKLNVDYVKNAYNMHQETEFHMITEILLVWFGVFIRITNVITRCFRSLFRQSKKSNILHTIIYKCTKYEYREYQDSVRKEWNHCIHSIYRFFCCCLNQSKNNVSNDMNNDYTEVSMNDEGLFELYDYEFVWWNAWLYSGSDSLWAGLIQALYEAVESRYGPEYCNAQKKANVYKISLLAFISILLLLGGVLAATLTSILKISDRILVFVVSLTISIVAFATSALTFIQAIRSIMKSPTKQSEKIALEVKSENIKAKLGFMATVKDELTRLGELLQNPTNLPNVWDYLLPNWLEAAKPMVKKVLTLLFGGNSLRGQRSCKLIIFVDDLDRCHPDKVVEVLQSLVLLTENTPFIVFLAVDPRIVVAAIESVNSKFFSEAGVSGYEYLDKIVHIPFAIPSLVQQEKSSLVAGYMLKQPKLLAGLCDETLQVQSGHVNCIIQLSDGRIASASRDGTVGIWNLMTGYCDMNLVGHTSILFTIIQLSDERIVSGSYDQTIRIWNIDTGECVMSLLGHTDAIQGLVQLDYSPLVSVSRDCSIRIWDVYTGECLSVIEGHNDRIFCVIQLIDDRIASGSKDKTIRIWNSNGSCDQVLTGHTDCIYTVIQLSDGSIASASSDKTVRIWDLTTSKCDSVLTGHNKEIYALMQLSDGRLASGSADNTIKIWNLHTGMCEETLTGHSAPVCCIIQLSDGRIASASDDGTIKIWI